MAFQKGMIGTAIVLGIALTLSAPLTAAAQGRGGPPPYTPAAGARDLRSVLFNWGWHLGMLRSDQERDLIASLEYKGTGTIQVDGQPCALTTYRISTNYQTSGQRTQISCTRPNGQTYSNVEVLSGAYAWDEDIPGAELIKGKGKATPMAAATQERMIRLWASPQGALKSALAGIQDPPLFAVRPGTQVPADVATAGKTSVVWEGGKPVVTFPIPGVPGATATATLDAKFMAERVVVRQGTNTTEFIYSDYRDWNNPLHPAEAFVAGKMTERRNGTVVRDITTTVDGNRADVCRDARARQRQSGDHANVAASQLGFGIRSSSASGGCSGRDAEAAQREAGHDGQLDFGQFGPTGWWEPPMWSNADPLQGP
jgi:hypothetical protein